MEKREAEAFLRRLKGYEEATAIMENRYLYAVWQGEETSGLKAEYLDMRRRLAAVRKEIFISLNSIENGDSRRVLWQLYIERKGKEETAEYLHMTVGDVERLRCKGLYLMKRPRAKWIIIE